MDEGGRLEGLARPLVGQPGGGELAQLVVDEGEELLGGTRVTLLGRGQDAGDLAHGPRIPPGRGIAPPKWERGANPRDRQRRHRAETISWFGRVSAQSWYLYCALRSDTPRAM